MRVVVAAISYRGRVTKEVLRAPSNHVSLAWRDVAAALRTAVGLLGSLH